MNEKNTSKIRKILEKGNSNILFNDPILYVITTLIAFACILIYTIASFISNLDTLSMELSMLSTCFLIFFEIYEWKIYSYNFKGKTKNNIKYISPFFFATILFILLLFIYRVLNIPAEKNTNYSNIITSTTMLGYYFSCTIRNFKELKNLKKN